MVNYLTFDTTITCTVNGTSVTSGYELQDGDVIVVKVDGVHTLDVNSEEYINGATADIYDTDIHIKIHVDPSSGAA